MNQRNAVAPPPPPMPPARPPQPVQEHLMQTETSDSVRHLVEMAAMTIDKRVATARSFPRDELKFVEEAKRMMALDPEIAKHAEYSKPQGESLVTGPSIRLMEELARMWMNLEIEKPEVTVGKTFVSVLVYAWDLQTNTRVPGFSRMTIVDKHGKRFAASTVDNNVLAVAKKARRNAIEDLIPTGPRACKVRSEELRAQYPGSRQEIWDAFEKKIDLLGESKPTSNPAAESEPPDDSD